MGVNVLLRKGGGTKIESECCKAKVDRARNRTGEITLSCSRCHGSLLVFDNQEQMKETFNRALDGLNSA